MSFSRITLRESYALILIAAVGDCPEMKPVMRSLGRNARAIANAIIDPKRRTTKRVREAAEQTRLACKQRREEIRLWKLARGMPL